MEISLSPQMVRTLLHSIVDEMMISVIWMFVGGIFYSFAIGNLTSILTNINTRKVQIEDKVAAISQFSKECNLDKNLTSRLRSAVYYITQKNFVWADKQKIFQELSAHIKSEIAKEMHNCIIK